MGLFCKHCGLEIDEDSSFCNNCGGKQGDGAEKFSAPIGDKENYLKLGDFEYESNNYEKALEHYDKALVVDPEYVTAWIKKGLSLRGLGGFEKAIRCYDKALEIDPNHAEVWYNKGLALRSLGRFDEAVKFYDKAIELDPNYHKAWINKALALDALGQSEEAIKCYDKARELSKDL